MLGVILSSLHQDNGVPHNNPRLSIAYAMLAALLYGTSFWLQGRYTLPALEPVTMLWLGYLVGLCVLLVMVVKIKDSLKVPPLKNCATLTACELDEPRRDRGDPGLCVFQGAVVGVQVLGVVRVLVGAVVLHIAD